MGTALFTEDPSSPFELNQPNVDSFFPTILQTNFGPPHCWFTPRSLALEVGGFREDLANSEDWEFWARVALTGARLVSVPYFGALYRRHAHSQVATTPRPAIVRGRLLVAETLAAGLLRNPDLLAKHGVAMFWSLWAMRQQARASGVTNGELQPAERLLRHLARLGPTELLGSTYARAVRFLGVRAADRLQRIVSSGVS
jgi:hypothetical protein